MKLSKIIIKLAIFIAVVASTSFISIARADAPTVPPKTSWTIGEVRDLADYYASQYGVSHETMRTVISAESQFQWDLSGDHGTSFGACQIHLPAHPDITKEQALNPDFCLDWTAKNISAGNGRMWTAFRTCILKEIVYSEGKQIPCGKQ